MESIFSLLNVISNDQNRSDALMRSAMGVIGYVLFSASSRVELTHFLSDIALTFPDGQFTSFYRSDWLTAMIKSTRQNTEYGTRTIETARWAREQVKRQIGGTQGMLQS